jgi:hypothetical protein
MTKKTYSEKLLDPRWQKKRLKIMERDNFSCTCCNDDKLSLQVHHLSYKGNPWDVDDNQLITLCLDCHGLYEFLKKRKESVNYIEGKIFKRINDLGAVSYAIQLKDKRTPDLKLLALYYKNDDNSFYSPEILLRDSYVNFLSDCINSL